MNKTTPSPYIVHTIDIKRQLQWIEMQMSFRTYFIYYLIGFSILAGIICFVCVCLRWVRIFTSHQDENVRLQRNATTQEENEDHNLEVEFNEKLQTARKHSIATVLPVEVGYMLYCSMLLSKTDNNHTSNSHNDRFYTCST